jgi:glycosyltransferase involved in cell wall biosynthesis
MPVYNDFESARLLVEQLDSQLEGAGASVHVVLADDGSHEQLEVEAWPGSYSNIAGVRVVRLRRNLGHQRAIAIGLTYIHEHLACDAVVVMDADGQDRPEDVPRLLRRLRETGFRKVIFAERIRRRPESLVFKICYQVYRVLHRVLAGIRVRVGNFSVVPWSCLARLVAVSELWNHYAAAVYKAQLPHESIVTERNPRICGTSKMNFPGLLVHGLSAISVFSEIVGARLLLFLLVLSFLGVANIVGLVVADQTRALVLPGWAIQSIGLMILVLCQIIIVCCGVVFFVMSSRDKLSFLPLRDYSYFIMDTVHLCPRAGGPDPAITGAGPAAATDGEA